MIKLETLPYKFKALRRKLIKNNCGMEFIPVILQLNYK